MGFLYSVRLFVSVISMLYNNVRLLLFGYATYCYVFYREVSFCKEHISRCKENGNERSEKIKAFINHNGGFLEVERWIIMMKLLAYFLLGFVISILFIIIRKRKDK